MKTDEKSRILRYCHCGASLGGLMLLVCGILSVLMFGLADSHLSEAGRAGCLSGIDQIMYSRVPSYLAIILGVVLCSVCLLQKAKITVASVVLSWLLSCLLMLLTVLSITAPIMRMQSQAP